MFYLRIITCFQNIFWFTVPKLYEWQAEQSMESNMNMFITLSQC